MIAVRAGGRGDVTGTHLLWKLKTTSWVPTPLYHDGRLYWVDRHGVACCADARTGQILTRRRLGKTGLVYASLVLADGRLYAVTRERGTVVLSADPDLKELARNDLDDPSIFNATPALSGGRLLLRSDRYLYCTEGTKGAGRSSGP